MYDRYSRFLCAVAGLSLLVACSGAESATRYAPVVASAIADNGPFPPACTTPRVKSGQHVTSITAFGNMKGRSFLLGATSTWTQVLWLKAPPPDAAYPARATTASAPRAGARYYLYFGTYTVSDGTAGCLYLLTTKDGTPITKDANASLTALPRIPDRGATLPTDFGRVSSVDLTLTPAGTGSGTLTLVHDNGSAAAGGTLTVVGRIAEQ